MSELELKELLSVKYSIELMLEAYVDKRHDGRYLLSVAQNLPNGDLADFLRKMGLDVCSGCMTLSEVLGALDEAIANARAKSYGECEAGERGQERCAGKRPMLFDAKPKRKSAGGDFIDPAITPVIPGIDKGSGEFNPSTSKPSISMFDSEMPMISMFSFETGTNEQSLAALYAAYYEPILFSGLTGSFFSGEGSSFTSKLMAPTYTKPIPEFRLEIPHVIPEIDKQSVECSSITSMSAKMKAPQRMSAWAMLMAAIISPFGESESNLIESVKIISGLTGGAFLSLARNMPSS